MAEQTLATVQELADWIGDPIQADSPDYKRAELCLRAASALVRAEAGRTWITEGDIVQDVPENVRMVTLYCASRVFDNREGQNRWNIDDAGGGWKVEEAGAYLTASEKDTLAGYAQRRHGGLGTVSTTRGDCGPSVAGYVPTEDGPPFPWY
ncbi:hypothetical protein M3G50_07365 [Brachybacterium muris]|uniref:hypothetical protein n=1 Tax=Brachybacterium muris TaxID=219301 RepID=UPI0021A8C5B1|nr:hypothetical protein [Brachybacterium muris]MCT1430571.1 hypothetical protein [Brachybacterium muris]